MASVLQRGQPIGHKFDFFEVQRVVVEIKLVIADSPVGVASLIGDFGKPIIDRIRGRRKFLERLIILLREIQLTIAEINDGTIEQGRSPETSDVTLEQTGGIIAQGGQSAG